VKVLTANQRYAMRSLSAFGRWASLEDIKATVPGSVQVGLGGTLRRLAQAGLVGRRRVGNRTEYRSTPEDLVLADGELSADDLEFLAARQVGIGQRLRAVAAASRSGQDAVDVMFAETADRLAEISNTLGALAAWLRSQEGNADG
jgi:hypothetical protein